MGYVTTHFLGGSYPVKPEPLPTFEQEIARFHPMVQAAGDLLEKGTALREITTEQLLQGPFADVMTHADSWRCCGAWWTRPWHPRTSFMPTFAPTDWMPGSRPRRALTRIGRRLPNDVGLLVGIVFPVVLPRQNIHLSKEAACDPPVSSAFC